MEIIITEEKQDLEKLEDIIQKNILAFYEVGQALREIRDRKLYKIKNGGAYQTFEEYCKGAWDFSRIRAYQLIESTKIREHLLTQVNIAPTSEKQLRPLAKLEPEKQIEVWKKAVETAPEGKVTTVHVYNIVEETTALENSKSEPKQQKHKPPLDSMICVTKVIQLLQRIPHYDPKRQEAFDLVIQWIGKAQK